MQLDPFTQTAVVWAAVATAFFTAIAALVATINSWHRITAVASRCRFAVVASWRHARRLTTRSSRDLRRRLWDYPNPHAETTPRTGGMAEEWACSAAESGDKILREPWKHLGSGRYVGGSSLSERGSKASPGLSFWWPDGSKSGVFWRAGNYYIEVNQPTSYTAWDWKPEPHVDSQWWATGTLAHWRERVDQDRRTTALPYECTVAVEVATDGTGGSTYRLMVSVRHDEHQSALSAKCS